MKCVPLKLSLCIRALFLFFFLHRTENGLRMPSNKNQTSDIKELRFFFIFIKSLAFFVRFVMLNKNNVRSGDFWMGCLFACASMHFWNFVLISNKREWKNWFLHFKRNKFHFSFSFFLPLLVILLVWLSSFWALAWVWIKISNKRKFNGYTVCVCFLMCDATLDIPNVLFHVFWINSEKTNRFLSSSAKLNFIFHVVGLYEYFRNVEAKEPEKRQTKSETRSLNFFSHTSRTKLAIFLLLSLLFSNCVGICTQVCSEIKCC